MNTPLAKPPVFYLKPGEMCFVRTPRVISTVLGSCVAVTMLHRKTGLAAICHAMLPVCKMCSSTACGLDECTRYVQGSVVTMLDKFAKHSVRPEELEVKLFGGATSCNYRTDNPRYKSVGDQNIDAAGAVLQEMGLKVSANNVGGAIGRKILFNTATGEVLLKWLGKAPPCGHKPSIKRTVRNKL